MIKSKDVIGMAVLFATLCVLVANAEMIWECPKTFTMSSKIGISDTTNIMEREWTLEEADRCTQPGDLLRYSAVMT